MNNYNGILAALANIKVKRGDTITLYATLTDPNNNDNPYDLSVFDSLEAGCKRWPSDSNFLWQKTLSYTGADSNVLIIPLTVAETDLITGKYFWSVIGPIGSTQISIVEGDYIIQASVQ